MVRSLTLISVALVWAVLTAPAHAQIAVWPGSVVAPFVRVEWNAWQVHVCAPFVNVVVDFPRCCSAPPICGQANQTMGAYSQSTARLYAHPTRQQLANSASKLYQSLAQFQTADSWRNYLALAPGGALSTEPIESLDAAASNNDNLIAVLRHFDAANRDQQYHQITTLPEFQQTHTLLANYLVQQPRLAGAMPKQSSVMVASSTAAISQSAKAIDTARTMPFNAQPVSAGNINASGAHHTIEELPAPIEKSGI